MTERTGSPTVPILFTCSLVSAPDRTLNAPSTINPETIRKSHFLSMLLILISSYMRSVCILYSGGKLYQYNDDDFLFKF